MLAVGLDDFSRVLQQLIPNEQCRAECATSIAGGRLNPDVFEHSFAQDSAIANAIERDAAGKTKIFFSGHGADVMAHSQHNFFGDLLNACSDVHVKFRELAVGFSRRLTEKRMEAGIGHGQALAIIKILHVHPKGAVLFKIDNLRAN